AQMRLGDCDHAHAQLRRALDTAERLGDTTALVAVHLTTSRVYEQQRRHREAIDEGRRALELVGDDQPDLRRGPLNTIAWQYALMGAYHDAIRYSREVVEANAGLSYVDAAAFHTLGFSEHRAGQPAAARTHLERAAAIYQQLGNQYREASTLDDVAEAALDDGDPAAARQAWQRALQIYADFGHP